MKANSWHRHGTTKLPVAKLKSLTSVAMGEVTARDLKQQKNTLVGEIKKCLLVMEL